MLRTSFYQNIGNPIQLARIPRRRLELAFPIRDIGQKQQAIVFLKLCGLLLIVNILETCAHVVLLGQGAVKPEVTLAAFAGVALAYTLCLTLKYKQWLTATGLSAIIVCFGLVLYAFSILSVLPAAIAFGSYVRINSEHWIQLCTSSLFRDRERGELLKHYRGYLICAQLTPALIFAVSQVFGLPLVFAMYLLGVFAIASMLHSTATCGCSHTFQTLWQSTVSWFTYNHHNKRLPGTFQSPGGSRQTRALLAVIAGLCVVSVIRIAHAESVASVLPKSDSFSLVTCIIVTLITVFLPAMLTVPILVDASKLKNSGWSPQNWTQVTQALRQSTNPISRSSYFMGRIVSDGSPLIVPRQVFREHAHFLGDSGSGKSSMGLAPFVEQTIGFGDCSVVIIDLKADSKELLTAVTQAARKFRCDTGFEIPIKFFNNQDDMSSFGLNVFRQNYWPLLNAYTRTDVIAGATGLEYGAGFGESYYSATNAAVLFHTLQLYPETQTFAELADRCGYVIANAKKRDLHPEVRKAGVHVHEVCKRLGAFAQLNVSPQGPFSKEVVENSIDLCSVFREPQILYFELSSLLSPGSSPAIARLVVYFLLAAATKTERQCPVFLVIDEFQRMVAKNLEYMLQLARSMDIGIILANQSMEDLRTGSIDLVTPLESNCRYRQWFSVSSSDDRKRIVESSGETVERLTSISVTKNFSGSSTTVSRAEHVFPRMTTTDVLLASDHPKQSVVRISRGNGYAQFGGMPFFVESDFHISSNEYEKRRRQPWPQDIPGTFVASKIGEVNKPGDDIGPIITTEDDSEAQNSDLDKILNVFRNEEKTATNKRQTNRRKRK